MDRSAAIQSHKRVTVSSVRRIVHYTGSQMCKCEFYTMDCILYSHKCVNVSSVRRIVHYTESQLRKYELCTTDCTLYRVTNV